MVLLLSMLYLFHNLLRVILPPRVRRMQIEVKLLLLVLIAIPRLAMRIGGTWDDDGEQNPFGKKCPHGDSISNKPQKRKNVTGDGEKSREQEHVLIQSVNLPPDLPPVPPFSTAVISIVISYVSVLGTNAYNTFDWATQLIQAHEEVHCTWGRQIFYSAWI